MKCGIMWSHVVLVSLALWQIGSCISIENCPDNLEQNVKLKAFGDKCYFFYLFIGREFNAAQDICRENGGNLVSIKSAKINSYLLDQLKNYYEYDGPVWIGLSDQANEKHYIWRDGSAMGYSNFESNTGPDTPSWDITNRGQDCVTMSPWSGEWEDVYCGDNILYNHHHAFVCEYDPKSESPPTTTTTRTTTLPSTTTLPQQSPATTITPAPPPTTTIASTATPTTLELILPNEDDLMTTTTPTTTKTTTAFIVPTSDPPPTTTSTPLSPTTTSTPTPPTTTTVKASTSSAPASSNDTSTAAATCPPIVCSKDCGMSGFATDEKTGCMMCKCQEK